MRRHLRRQRHGGRRGGCDGGRRVSHPRAASGRFALRHGISIGSVLGQSWVSRGSILGHPQNSLGPHPFGRLDHPPIRRKRACG
eukprot:620672-Pyramimonas_sp.AAC.1